jgi:hypothetical protein
VSRTTLVIVVLAALVGIALAGGMVLISSDDDGTQKPQAGRSPTSERAPEAEDHSVGELPAAETAARRFLAGYLPLIYGKRGATVDDLRSASPRLIAAIRAEGGHVTPAQSQRTPRLQRVTVIEESTGVLATAQIKDSPSPAYPLVFHLQDTPEGWVVTRIGGP